VFISILVVTLAAGALTYLNAIPAGLGVFLFVTAGWLVSLCLHEFSHAAAAYLSGDESVVNHGYLTLNPFRYTRLFLSIILPLLFLMSGGIGLPGGAVYINMAAIRKPRLRSLVSAAGPLANLSFAILLSVLYLVLTRLSNFTDHIEFFAGLTLLIFLQLTALVLNLIPLPGLDGFGILAPYLPDSLLRIAYLFGQFSILILIIIFFYNNPVRQVFWDSIGLAMRIANLDPALVITGLDLFRFWTG
jgi:Zn-dependent protease